jgi:hypothetical protein
MKYLIVVSPGFKDVSFVIVFVCCFIIVQEHIAKWNFVSQKHTSNSFLSLNWTVWSHSEEDNWYNCPQTTLKIP